MPYRTFIFFSFLLASFLIGEHYYRQYEKINQSGGEIRLLDKVIYSVSKEKKVHPTYNIERIPKQENQVSKYNVTATPLPTIQNVCPARNVNPIKENRKDLIYKWKDENGRTVLTNRPSAVSTSSSELNNLKINEYDLPDKYFDLNIDFKYVGYVSQLRNKLDINLRNTYKVMMNLLGKERLRLTTVNLQIYGDKNKFRSFRQQAAPNLNENTAGFYQYGNGVSLASTYAFPDPANTISVSLHESFHVMAHELFVSTPVWFNEGMAEYFETMTTMNAVATIHAQSHWYNTLRQSNLNNLSLERLVTMTHKDFYSNNNNINSFNYAAAWSLTSYLMHDQKGRNFLKIFTQHMFDFYCIAPPTLQLMEQYYSGGIRALETGWHKWVLAGNQTTQTWRF